MVFGISARNSTCCSWTTSSSSPASIASAGGAEEFFHALTALSERGRQVVLTCDCHPRDIRNLDARIKSRLESGLATDVGKPDWEMRTAIVRGKAAALGMELPDGVAETIASRYKNNVGELQGLLNSLVASSQANGVKISSVFLQRILSAHPSRRSPRPSIQDVQTAVAKAFGMAPLRLIGPQRGKALVLARHVAMYLCRENDRTHSQGHRKRIPARPLHGDLRYPADRHRSGNAIWD